MYSQNPNTFTTNQNKLKFQERRLAAKARMQQNYKGDLSPSSVAQQLFDPTMCLTRSSFTNYDNLFLCQVQGNLTVLSKGNINGIMVVLNPLSLNLASLYATYSNTSDKGYLGNITLDTDLQDTCSWVNFNSARVIMSSASTNGSTNLLNGVYYASSFTEAPNILALDPSKMSTYTSLAGNSIQGVAIDDGIVLLKPLMDYDIYLNTKQDGSLPPEFNLEEFNIPLTSGYSNLAWKFSNSSMTEIISNLIGRINIQGTLVIPGTLGPITINGVVIVDNNGSAQTTTVNSVTINPIITMGPLNVTYSTYLIDYTIDSSIFLNDIVINFPSTSGFNINTITGGLKMRTFGISMYGGNYTTVGFLTGISNTQGVNVNLVANVQAYPNLYLQRPLGANLGSIKSDWEFSAVYNIVLALQTVGKGFVWSLSEYDKFKNSVLPFFYESGDIGVEIGQAFSWGALAPLAMDAGKTLFKHVARSACDMLTKDGHALDKATKLDHHEGARHMIRHISKGSVKGDSEGFAMSKHPLEYTHEMDLMVALLKYNLVLGVVTYLESPMDIIENGAEGLAINNEYLLQIIDDLPEGFEDKIVSEGELYTRFIKRDENWFKEFLIWSFFNFIKVYMKKGLTYDEAQVVTAKDINLALKAGLHNSPLCPHSAHGKEYGVENTKDRCFCLNCYDLHKLILDAYHKSHSGEKLFKNKESTFQLFKIETVYEVVMNHRNQLLGNEPIVEETKESDVPLTPIHEEEEEKVAAPRSALDSLRAVDKLNEGFLKDSQSSGYAMDTISFDKFDDSKSLPKDILQDPVVADILMFCKTVAAYNEPLIADIHNLLWDGDVEAARTLKDKLIDKKYRHIWTESLNTGRINNVLNTPSVSLGNAIKFDSKAQNLMSKIGVADKKFFDTNGFAMDSTFADADLKKLMDDFKKKELDKALKDANKVGSNRSSGLSFLLDNKLPVINAQPEKTVSARVYKQDSDLHKLECYAKQVDPRKGEKLAKRSQFKRFVNEEGIQTFPYLISTDGTTAGLKAEYGKLVFTTKPLNYLPPEFADCTLKQDTIKYSKVAYEHCDTSEHVFHISSEAISADAIAGIKDALKYGVSTPQEVYVTVIANHKINGRSVSAAAYLFASGAADWMFSTGSISATQSNADVGAVWEDLPFLHEKLRLAATIPMIVACPHETILNTCKVVEDLVLTQTDRGLRALFTSSNCIFGVQRMLNVPLNVIPRIFMCINNEQLLNASDFYMGRGNYKELVQNEKFHIPAVNKLQADMSTTSKLAVHGYIHDLNTALNLRWIDACKDPNNEGLSGARIAAIQNELKINPLTWYGTYKDLPFVFADVLQFVDGLKAKEMITPQKYATVLNQIETFDANYAFGHAPIKKWSSLTAAIENTGHPNLFLEQVSARSRDETKQFYKEKLGEELAEMLFDSKGQPASVAVEKDMEEQTELITKAVAEEFKKVADRINYNLSLKKSSSKAPTAKSKKNRDSSDDQIRNIYGIQKDVKFVNAKTARKNMIGFLKNPKGQDDEEKITSKQNIQPKEFKAPEISFGSSTRGSRPNNFVSLGINNSSLPAPPMLAAQPSDASGIKKNLFGQE